MLAAAMASGKDADVAAVAKLAKAPTPEDAAEIEEQVVAYRAERQRLKDEAAEAARAKLAQARFWENEKGEGQIGESQSSGNTRPARSEERRVGKECDSTGNTRWPPTP